MESVDLEESIEMRCTLYEQFAYEDEYESRPAVMALSNDERRKQRERDKEDFLEWLWLSPLAGGMAGDAGRNELNRLRQFAKANGLVCGRGPHYRELEELIKEAVEDDLIVPVIDRTDEFGVGYLPPTTSPQASPLSDGLLRASGGSFAPALEGFANGEPILSGPYDPAMQESQLKAARSASWGAGDGGSGFNWMGFAGAAAGAFLGGPPSDSDESPGLLAKSFGDVQPFEYVPERVSGGVLELAGADGRPGHNQAQNKQFKAVVKALGLNKDQARRLHYDIQEDDLEYHGIMERAFDMFGDQSE